MRRAIAFGSALLLLAAWFGVASPRSSAATMLALDLGELVRLSEHVVVAKAERRTSRQLPDAGYIVTDVELRVLTALKGGSKAGDTLVATLLGGSVGDLGLHVAGEAVIPEDRSAIVFLRRSQRGDLNVTGMSQGVLPIVGQGQKAQVLPGGADAELVEAGEDGALREAPDALERPQSLSRLLSEIRRLSREQPSK